MVTDIETILDAFKGNWKPGIEEQSIRTAHSVALSGDTATASNILKFIAIPEPMKLQILGASLSGVGPVQPGQIPGAPSEPDKPLKMPEPLLPDNSTIPNLDTATQLSGIHLVTPNAPEPPKAPAFGSDLSAGPVPVEQNIAELSTTPADAGLIIDTSPQIEKPPLQSPVGSLPQDRKQAFENAFHQVKVTASTTTSRPMIKDADNIEIIKTYAEPEISSVESLQAQKSLQQNGLKMFQLLETTIAKANNSKDSHLIATTLNQFDRLDNEFPDFKSHNKSIYDSIVKSISELKTVQSSSQDTTVAQGIETSPVASGGDTKFVPLDEAKSKESFTIDTEPAVVVSPEAIGSYFSKKAPIEHASTTESVQSTNLQDQNQLRDSHSDQSASEITKDTELGSDTENTTEYELSNGIKIFPNMTITGDSIYRVTSFERMGNSMYILFTNEVNTYKVSSTELEQALSVPDTDPDEFFAQHILNERHVS